jgi:hypothetical protein
MSAVGPSQTTKSGRKPRLTAPAAVIVAIVPPSTRPRCRAIRARPAIGPRAQPRQSDSAIDSPMEPNASRVIGGAPLPASAVCASQPSIPRPASVIAAPAA